MNINGYLFTINKNNGFKLDPDEIKDVNQEINIYLLNRSYNDLLIKKTVLSFYKKALNIKIKNENIKTDFNGFSDPGHEEKKERRLTALQKLPLNDQQKKILQLLIEGYEYPEIRKRLKLN